jgi:hypothetical protein
MTTERATGDQPSENAPTVSVLHSLLQIKWLLFIVVTYALSIMPAYVIMLLLRSHGIDLFAFFQVFYWPVIWLIDNVSWARRLNGWIEPVLRGLAGRP